MMTPEEILASLSTAPMPFSDDAEKGVLSCILQKPALIAEAPMPDAFYHSANREIFLAMLALHASKGILDPVLLTHKMRDEGTLDRAGGAATISELYSFIPIPAHWPHYRKIVAEKHALRTVITACASAASQLLHITDQASSVDDAISNALAEINAIDTLDTNAELPNRPIREILQSVIEKAQERATNPGAIPGISTGIEGIDELTGGLQPGRLWTISAESSEGKSSLGRQMIEYACMLGHAGVIYTYEMMDDEEGARILCSHAKIESNALKFAKLENRYDQERLVRTMRQVSEWNIAIVDVSGKTIETIVRDIARRKKRLPKGSELVALIDYTQLCKTSVKAHNREREVAHITSTAKQCAKMNKCTIIMPSQENKDGEVRESMAIEQDSDVLIQIRKPAAVAKKPAYQQSTNEEPDWTRELWLKKNRDGEKFRSVKVTLNGKFFRFDPAY